MMNLVPQSTEGSLTNPNGLVTPLSIGDDSAIMSETMGFVPTARCGQKGDVATPPLQTSSATLPAAPATGEPLDTTATSTATCVQTASAACAQKATLATPPELPNEERIFPSTVSTDDNAAVASTTIPEAPPVEAGVDEVAVDEGIDVAEAPNVEEDAAAEAIADEEAQVTPSPDEETLNALLETPEPPPVINMFETFGVGQKSDLATAVAARTMAPTSLKTEAVTPPEIPGDLLAASSVDVSAIHALFNKIFGDDWQTQNKLSLKNNNAGFF